MDTDDTVASPMAEPGWYAAQGDPVGTLRYWDGSAWVGGPTPNETIGVDPSLPDAPAVEWSPHGLVRVSADYASWGRRVAAWFVDQTVMLPFFVAAFAVIWYSGEQDEEPGLLLIGVLLVVAGLVAAIVNSIIVQGITGQSLGKRVVGTRLIRGDGDEPAGVGRVFARGLVAGVLGQLTFGLYFLVDMAFPLWDQQRQRVSDKIVGTHVTKV